MSKEKKTKPIEGAEGFYVYRMLDGDDKEYAHFKFSMPAFSYIAIPSDLADDEAIMEHVTKEGILAVIYEAELTIAKYKATL
jgi:hypothetical protein